MADERLVIYSAAAPDGKGGTTPGMVPVSSADPLPVSVEGVTLDAAQVTVNWSDYPPGAVPFADTGDSVANAALAVTQVAGAAGKCNYCAGFSVDISGAAVGATPVVVTIKDGASIICKKIIPAATAIGEAISVQFVKPLIGTAATAMSLNVAAAGAGCITTGNINGYTT